jgi:ribose 5-phosphate isomerase B
MIAIGSDHAGYDLKIKIRNFIQEKGYDVLDLGTCACNSVDYPDYGLAVAEAVKDRQCEEGIIVCGTGLGISMAANKVPGIRAAVCTNEYMAKMSREHNDANILALGSRVVGEDLAISIVKVWLESEFQEGKHKIRVDKISEIEKKYLK